MLNIPKQTYGNGGKPIPKPSKESTIRRKAENRASVEQLKRDAAKEAAPKRKPIGARLRAMVMERDGMACTRCGQVAGPGVTLHIDHIEPVASGGTNCETNLRTLCSECNLGRGARGEPVVAIEPPPTKPPVSEEDKRLLAEKDAQTNALIAKVRKGKT